VTPRFFGQDTKESFLLLKWICSWLALSTGALAAATGIKGSWELLISCHAFAILAVCAKRGTSAVLGRVFFVSAAAVDEVMCTSIRSPTVQRMGDHAEAVH
jgi:hypothetical protein